MHKYIKNIIKSITVAITLCVIGALVWGSFSWAEYTKIFQNPNIVITGNSIVDESEYYSFLQ